MLFIHFSETSFSCSWEMIQLSFSLHQSFTSVLDVFNYAKWFKIASLCLSRLWMTWNTGGCLPLSCWCGGNLQHLPIPHLFFVFLHTLFVLLLWFFTYPVPKSRFIYIVCDLACPWIVWQTSLSYFDQLLALWPPSSAFYNVLPKVTVRLLYVTHFSGWNNVVKY